MPDALSPPLPIARGAWDCSPWVDGSASARLLILTVLCSEVVSKLLSNPVRRTKMKMRKIVTGGSNLLTESYIQ